jgi:hypothetical protein
MRKLLEDPDAFYSPAKRPSGHDIAKGFGPDILRRHGTEPAPERSRKATWKEFLRRHAFGTCAKAPTSRWDAQLLLS